MVDREARDLAIVAIEEFLEDKITAFTLRDRLWDIKTDDTTLMHVVDMVYRHYDDLIDHKVTLSKREWDYIQRLLLLLSSDMEIKVEDKKRWSWDHAFAGVFLIVFLCLAFYSGWGLHLFALSFPFGVLSMLISFYRTRMLKGLSTYEIAFYPFTSLSEIGLLKDHAPNFIKRKYRKEISNRVIRTKSDERFVVAQQLIPRLLFSPIILLIQCFPYITREFATLKQPE